MTPRIKLLTIGLLAGATAFPIAAHANARLLFSTDATMDGSSVEADKPVVQTAGVTQVELPGGGVASFVDAAEYSIRADGGIDLKRGSVTVSLPGGGSLAVHLPDGVVGRLQDAGSVAAFIARPGEASTGHVMTGKMVLALASTTRTFSTGQFFRASASDGIDRTIAGNVQAAPGPDQSATADRDPSAVADARTGGPAAVAANGMPIALGNSLASAGASAEIVAAGRRIEAAVGNPSLESFPSGDFALLAQYASRASAPYGGQAFPGAGADIVRTYFQWLASGGNGYGSGFLSAYAGFLGQYLDLIRSGAAPSSFSRTSQAQINSFISYQGRINAFGTLSSSNRRLVEAYLTFLQGGGNPDRFTVTYTELSAAYLAFLRTGGVPTDFTTASQSTVHAYLSFLNDANLLQLLSAQDRALIAQYLHGLANGGNGIAFASQYRATLDAWYIHLDAGFLPSSYTAADITTLRAYLETLESTGMFATVLGSRATYFQSYLAYLRTGGAPDGWSGLNANVFASYASRIDAFNLYLAGGNLPSGYSELDATTLRSYLEALAKAGALQRYLGSNANFYTAYLTFLQNGGTYDGYGDLPVNIFTNYGTSLSLYFTYLKNGGIPSAYTALSQAEIRAYLDALERAGVLARFTGDYANFYSAYFAYIQNGGNPDLYANLPVPPDFPRFASTLQSYVTYLRGGGLPGSYTAVDLQTLQAYIDAIIASGRATELLGENAVFLTSYFTYIRDGGAPNGYFGLPIYADYAANLRAYFLYLEGGGLPSAYTSLTQVQLQAYLKALTDAGVMGQLFTGQTLTYLTGFYAHLQGGGTVTNYAGTPSYSGYASALTAYYAYLQGGGLPSGYTALTPDQIRAYLQALSDAGVLNQLFTGATLSYLTSFYTHLQGGGTITNYGASPVYANYVTALNAYYIYLQGGGRPSAYTALTQAQIQAYLQALVDAGLVGQFFSGTSLTFFTSYQTYLAGGGTPDTFTGLPTVTPPSGSFTYAGGFTNGDGVKAYYSKAGYGYSSNTILMDSDGTPSSDTRYKLVQETARASEVGGDAAIVVGRLNDGQYRYNANGTMITETATANGGLPYFVGQPIVGTLPTSGKIDYTLYAATAPIYSNASTAPGTFAANLTLQFGAQWKFGMDGTITMPDATYALATAGRSTGQLVNFDVPRASDFVFGFQNTATGSACTSGNCYMLMYGSFAGSNPQNRMGINYQYTDNTNFTTLPRILGAAAFAANGTLGTGGTTTPVTPPSTTVTPLSGYGGGFTAANPITRIVTSLGPTSILGGGAGGEYNRSANSYALNSSGMMTQYAVGTLDRSSGTTTVTDIFGNADAIIGRWTNGQTAGTAAYTLSANQGFHYFFNRPISVAFSLPTSGQINYNLIASTKPTIADGSLAPGVFEARMAFLFGSSIRVAMEGSITMPTSGSNSVFNFSTQGGMANPSQTTTGVFHSTGAFQYSVSATQSTRPCGSSGCSVDFNGSFTGNNTNTIGMTYTAQNGDINKTLIGAALFGAQTTSAPAIPAPAPASAPAMADASNWARWDAPTAASALPMLSLDTPATALPGSVSATESQRSMAEALLGGKIRFDNK